MTSCKLYPGSSWPFINLTNQHLSGLESVVQSNQSSRPQTKGTSVLTKSTDAVSGPVIGETTGEQVRARNVRSNPIDARLRLIMGQVMKMMRLILKMMLIIILSRHFLLYIPFWSRGDHIFFYKDKNFYISISLWKWTSDGWNKFYTFSKSKLSPPKPSPWAIHALASWPPVPQSFGVPWAWRRRRRRRRWLTVF